MAIEDMDLKTCFSRNRVKEFSSMIETCDKMKFREQSFIEAYNQNSRLFKN